MAKKKDSSCDSAVMVFIFIVALSGAAIFAGSMYVRFTTADIEVTYKYDCRLSEIAVDYPIAVKEECRKLSQPRRVFD